MAISMLSKLSTLRHKKERPLMYGRNNGASQSVTLHVGRYGSFDSAELGKFQKNWVFLLDRPGT